MKIIEIQKLVQKADNNFAIIDRTITQKGGIYFLFDKDLELIYIGKAKNIRQRLVQHCSNKSTRWGEYEYPFGVTPCKKGEVVYFSYIEIENEKERKIQELILLSIIETKYNLKDFNLEPETQQNKPI